MGPDGESEFGTFGVGGRNHLNTLYVYGFRAGTSPRGDLLTIIVRGIAGPKAEPLADGFCTTICTAVVLRTNASVIYGDLGPNLECALDSGSIDVVELTAQRARGTFTGQGDCIDLRNARWLPGIFRITNGSFDVPIVGGIGLYQHGLWWPQ
jgi:hypothetical protein